MFARGTVRAEPTAPVRVTKYLLHSDSILQVPAYRLLNGLSEIVSYRIYNRHSCLEVEFREEVRQLDLLEALGSLGGNFVILSRGVDLVYSRRDSEDNRVNVTVIIEKMRLNEIDILRFFANQGYLAHADFVCSSEGEFASVGLEYLVEDSSRTVELTANIDIYPQLELTRLERATCENATIWMLSRTRSRSTIRNNKPTNPDRHLEDMRNLPKSRVKQALKHLSRIAEGSQVPDLTKPNGFENEEVSESKKKKVGSYSVQEHDGINYQGYGLLGFYSCEESESQWGLDDSFLSSSEKSVGYSIEERIRTEEDCSDCTQFRLEKGHSSVPMITYCWPEGELQDLSNTSERSGLTTHQASLPEALKHAYLQPTISYYAFPTENNTLGKQL